ncbi:TerB family tellurite resistance protein [Chitinophaga varians]|uniref:TerB family tellurite resistance protein n=1 Tax=Chitinophaga varians TaxID=2202339 RepID=A0A847RNF3_9BACT|nr:TerB family tellurite resistance protein [Chitinophaga varians]NLR68519.1 TerB family tellurite resistance protein [Chitinophaga varians]
MKKILLLLVLLLAGAKIQLASAQAAELEQLALNLEKLAQLKSILSDLKRGYDIVSKGYGTIKNISEGNFNIHEVFLNGLLRVNPGIARYSKVPAIVSGQARMLSEYRTAWRQFRAGGRFTEKELDYMLRVYGNLLDRSLRNLDELTMVLTSGQLRMSDDERIKAIDRLYNDTNEKTAFLQAFNKRASAINDQREAYLRENKTLRSLYHN